MSAEALVQLIDLFRGERRYNKELMDLALTAISEAIVATRSYEVHVKATGSGILAAEKRNQAEEVRIGGLWQAAAIKTRKVSPDFSSRLNDKALYWFTHFPYGAEEVVARRIDWTSIDQEVHGLLAADS